MIQGTFLTRCLPLTVDGIAHAAAANDGVSQIEIGQHIEIQIDQLEDAVVVAHDDLTTLCKQDTIRLITIQVMP